MIYLFAFVFAELCDLEEAERQKALLTAGLTREQMDESLAFLAALPAVSLKVTCEVGTLGSETRNKAAADCRLIPTIYAGFT